MKKKQANRTWDYATWIDEALSSPLDDLEPSHLYETIANCSRDFLFQCERVENGLLLVSASDRKEKLLLGGENVPEVLCYIERKYMQGLDADTFQSATLADMKDREKYGAPDDPPTTKKPRKGTKK